MMTVLSYIYYGFGVFALLYELCCLQSTKKIMKAREILKGKGPYPTEVVIWVILMVLYSLWALCGLFTSQWIGFLALIGLPFLPLKRSYWGTKIDAAFSIAILLLIIINRFHT